MSINPAGAAASSLNVFGSWVTEMSAESLPEGVSPDNQDMIFSPGQAGGRPALQKIFSTPFPGNPTCISGKSFVLPNGNIKNLYFNSDGTLYVEDLTNSPGTYTLLLQSTPASYFKSITAFGKEYIAISDGLHGSDVPLQYDGTFLDRVTQDGPGTPPIVSSYIIPASTLTTAPPVTATIVSIDNGLVHMGIRTNPNILLTAPVPYIAGQAIVISGTSNSFMNRTATIATVGPTANTFSIILAAPSTQAFTSTGGTVTNSSAANTLTRQGNTVTGFTATAHGLQVGYQVQITGVTASVVGGTITSIVINNEDSPGIATITTSAPHELLPENEVTITGVTATAVGGAITAAVRNGDIATITTTTAHGLAIGANVTVAGVTDPTFNGPWIVATVVDDLNFTYADVDANSTSSGGSVTLNWPIPDTPTPTFFEVLTAPTPTTFQVQINYADGTWTGGTVSFGWDGTFYVKSVIGAAGFTYQQYGPDASTTDAGTVTPFGQAAPGIHQCQVSFLTRQGAITQPSPPTTFIANGGQYISVTNIPIGPANVVGRILEFTGALGSFFFYIPTAAQVNGQIVSTATQINDNTTSSLIFDFSDNTLYASIATSIPGNNLAAQIVLDGALGFGYYDTRLVTYGQRNKIQNLLNMSFDGGTAGAITGWKVVDIGGTLVVGKAGLGAYRINTATGDGKITQSFFEDAYGAPIGTANTFYDVRAYLSGAGTIQVSLSSASTAFLATATFGIPTPGWYQVPFSIKTPATIPNDMLLVVQGVGGTTGTIDEISIIYDQTPFLDGILFGSYGNNPEGIDGVTSKFGPVNDTRKVMDFGIIRDTFYMLTQEPSGRLHETSSNGVTEPAGWTVNEVAANCGALSAFSITKSQADDSTAAGGEEWLAWASSSGARIFSGDNPWKISQEIQPNWFNQETPTNVQINMSAALSVFAINDPIQRVIYFGLPIGSATAPSLLYPVNYRELDTAYAIANSPPYHPSLAGKLVATDNTRKWTRWNMRMNGMARMYRTPSQLAMIFFGGNGLSGVQTGFGNVYQLNPAMLTDDDYGQIFPTYTSYFFVGSDAEQALQLDAGRKIISYLSSYMNGVGNITFTALCDRVGNPWPLTLTRALSLTPNFDIEGGMGVAQGQRMAIKMMSSPITGTDNTFSVSKLTLWLKKARLLVRGAAQ